jgi:hypothetical protein
VARGARYLALGYLAIHFGDAALKLMQTRGPEVALWLVAAIVLAAVARGGHGRAGARSETRP